MLQILRNKAQSIVIQAVVVIIALVFIFFGVGPGLMNSRESAIVVNDEEISFQEFDVAYKRAYERIENQFGGQVPKGLLDNLGIKDQVVNQLIQEALLRQGAAEMGIMVSSEEIMSTIEGMVQFEENGQFDMEKYKSVLTMNGFTPHSFEQSMRTDMLAQKASLEIGNFATSATEFEIEDLFKMEKSTVSVNYVAINQNDFIETMELNDEDLTAWYETAQERYKTDPEIQLSYLDFSYETVGDKVTIDAEKISGYYKENLDEFTQKEQRRARHILFKAGESSPEDVHKEQEKKAKEILELAKNGDDFIELAKKYSEGPSKDQGGDLGLFSRGRMVKSFEDAAFALKVGEVSDVVKSTFGYHIIKVESIVPEEIKSFDEVKDTILRKLQTEAAKPLAFEMATQAYDEIFAAGSLEAYLAANKETKLEKTEFFNRNSPPAEFRGDPKLLDTIFKLKEKELSSLIETPNGYAILYAEAIKEPEVPELSSIKDRITADFKSDKAKELALTKANDLLAKTKELNSLNKAAEANGDKVVNSGPLSKSSTENNALARPLVESAFKLTPANPYPEEPVAHNNMHYVLEFENRKPPEEEMTEADKERYENAILQLKQQQILSSWLSNRRDQAKIFRHKNL